MNSRGFHSGVVNLNFQYTSGPTSQCFTRIAGLAHNLPSGLGRTKSVHRDNAEPDKESE
jgi:hypothetical protein